MLLLLLCLGVSLSTVQGSLSTCPYMVIHLFGLEIPINMLIIPLKRQLNE